MGVLVAPVAAALTVQDAGGARRVQGVDPSLLTEQLLAALRSLPGRAPSKVGLLGGAPQAQTLAAVLESVPGLPVVLDPVLSASPGGSLAAADFLPALRQALLAKVTVLTPNLSEAGALLGAPLAPGAGGRGRSQRKALRELGPTAVLLKGGHLPRAPTAATTSADQYGGMWLESTAPAHAQHPRHGLHPGHAAGGLVGAGTTA